MLSSRVRKILSLVVKPALILGLIAAIVVPAGCGRPDLSRTVSPPGEAPIGLHEQSSFDLLDVFVLIDQSGSMSVGEDATDPLNKRITATEHLINSLMLKSLPDNPHRVGVINFGSAVPEEFVIGLTPVANSQDADILVKKLEPLNLGWTNFIDALKRAGKGFNDAATIIEGRKPVIIIFTDGEPADIRKLQLREYFSEIDQFVNDALADVTIFLVTIDVTGAYWPRVGAYWQEIISSDNISKLTDMDELQKKFIEISSTLLGISGIREEVTAAGLDFEVLPYLEAMELHLFPDDPELELIIYKPDGQRLDFDADYVDTVGGIIWIRKPPPGKWRYEIVQDRGHITMFRNSIPADVKLYYPTQHYPMGKEAGLLVSFRYQDGSPVVSLPAYPLAMAMELTGPDGIKQQIPMVPEKNGIYRSAETFQFAARGSYQLAVSIRGGAQFIYRRNFTIETADLPYLVIEQPRRGETVPLKNNILVRARFFYHGETTDPAKMITWTPDSMVLAQLIDPANGKEINPVWLAWHQDGYWEGELPFDGEEGNYNLLVRLIGTMVTDGEEIASDSMVSFFIAPTLKSRIMTYLRIAVFFFIAIIIIAALLFSLWKFRLPLMQGELELRPDQGRGPRVRLTRKKVIFQRMAGEGAKSGGWLMIYSPRGQREYVILRWSKQLFCQKWQLRSHNQHKLGWWTIEFR